MSRKAGQAPAVVWCRIDPRGLHIDAMFTFCLRATFQRGTLCADLAW